MDIKTLEIEFSDIEHGWIKVNMFIKEMIKNVGEKLDTNIINFVDELLWVTSSNKDKNDSFEDYLSIENKQKLNEAETSFLKSYDLYKKYKELYKKIEFKQ